MIFGYGIVTSLRKRVAAQKPPYSHYYSENYAVIVDGALHILGTGGTVKTGMP